MSDYFDNKRFRNLGTKLKWQKHLSINYDELSKIQIFLKRSNIVYRKLTVIFDAMFHLLKVILAACFNWFSDSII